ncbi:bifunctional methylenetetrahydrofolate dehydrogenase/methenyltetrahydrofolate cyclohydrolase FolD [Apibacter adventoris]|uniref:bifunctional methylenetetrahydrofolate dehydrogenase/methenyltetrahydrofolate cyclohydrolase FolD n=1 Tax=Apibacter adventoris TaxID=1679466 RepID=UPI000CF6C92C|nr:bifunctional methylenetetrahydrofolate dehydrogenase/methenyltetrahydrofolate cyclohydrolase FolD [Apibacter adventoris]PQL94046.1 bifunctional methylenetetrahydrofolate dehydrogenase/methenyltetrahydrofolate cyclohydrolase FolD [Apibacter adventoris]
MANILDGLKLSKQIKQEIKKEVAQYVNKSFRPPHLSAVLVGNNGASVTYVDNKIKDCHAVGFRSSLVKLPGNINENELLQEIKKLNEDKDLDGFIVQLPLPDHIDQEKIIMAIDPEKDVDGFHPQNFGKMALEMESFLPATPYGIMTMLKRYNVPTQGKNVVVIGRSRIVGKPMSILMSRKGYPGDATVTLTHSKTQNLQDFTKNADIVITALGVPNFLKGSMIKKGAVIIDVGITRIDDSTKERGFYLAGDVDYNDVSEKASWITPVPGGVGPMTRAMLLKNTLIAYKKNIND